MKKSLPIRAGAAFICGLLFFGILLFLPVGSFAYWNAWLLVAALFIPMLIFGTVLMLKDPELLEKRLNHDEKEKQQKIVIVLSFFMFVGGFAVAGLDFRFGWSKVPFWLVVSATALLLVSYCLYCEVMRENAYISRTVEVQENQQVVSTGLYGIVRHPMYFSTVLLFLSMPLILGSFWSFAIFLLYPFLLVGRILNEEDVLKAGLPGYGDYMKKVKYRLIPFIW